jgi:hypothetical protein
MASWRGSACRRRLSQNRLFLERDGEATDLRRPGGGRPDQYDELRIEHDEGDVEIVVYNRAVPT